MSKQKRNIPLILCATLALAACNGQSSSPTAAPGDSQAGKSTPKEIAGTDDLGAVADKANAWLDVIANRTVTIHSSRGIATDSSYGDLQINGMPKYVKTYLKAVDKDGELDLQRLTGHGSMHQSNNGLDRFFLETAFPVVDTEPTSAERQHYLDFLKQIADKSPSLPTMDQAGLAYGQRVADLVATFSDAHRYYSSGAYKLDDFKQGKALHCELVAQYRAVVSAGQALQDAHDALYQQQHQKELAQLQHDGKQAIVAVYQANDATDELFDGLVGRWQRDGNLDGVDIKQLQASVDKLEQLAAHVKQFEGEAGRLQEEHIQSDHLEHFAEAVDEAVISAKVLIKELHQGHDEALLKDLQEKHEHVVNWFNTIVS